MLDTSVKYSESTQLGAPVITSAPGALITWLDMYLITGWGTTATTSIVISNEVGTAYFSAGHPIYEDSVAGFLNIPVVWADLGTERRVFGVGPNSFSFDATGLPNGTINGVSVKVPGLGWEKPFSGPNKAVYRSAQATGPRHYLRVDDAYENYALVKAYVNMTDVDTGTLAYPGNDVDSRWMKTSSSGTSQFSWICGDNKAFLYGVQNEWYYWMFGFGEYVSEDPGDVLNSFVAVNPGPISAGDGNQDWFMRPSYGGVYTQTVTGTPQPTNRNWAFNFTGTSGASNGSVSPLNLTGGKIFSSPMYFMSNTNPVDIKGIIPGLHGITNFFSHTGKFITKVNGSVRTLKGRPSLPAAYGGNGAAGLDITGPWR